MTPARYRELNGPNQVKMTEEEMKEGFHWCYDWDYLLVSSNPKHKDFCEICDCHYQEPVDGSTSGN